MWLLHCSTNELRSFLSEEDLPPYAILSHTWGTEEATFQLWQAAYCDRGRYEALPEGWEERSRRMLHALRGYEKIERCQHQAQAEGLQWVWIDTCCIDKQSSAELSEAINSMYRWYRKATVCYAYLEDVSSVDGDTTTPEFGHSRWFTRGWTLQELLAPSDVEFYTRDWTKIGTKASLAASLQSITGIEKNYLTGHLSIHAASISKRMSWASRRNTTRVEDTAYSLLGIFDINMSLLYGEGGKAFERLQRLLLQEFPLDHTLFAWGTVVEKKLPTEANHIRTMAEVPVRHNETPRPLLGLLADSPRAFSGSASFIPVPWAYEVFAPQEVGAAFTPCAPAAVVGRTVRLEVPLFHGGLYLRHLTQPPVTQLQGQMFAPLLCTEEEDRSVILHVPLARLHIGLFGRTEELAKIRTSLLPATFRGRKLPRDIAPEPSTCRNLTHGSVVIRAMSANIADFLYGFYLEQLVLNVPQQGKDTSALGGSRDWVWPVYKGVLREHLTVFSIPVNGALLEDTGIIFGMMMESSGAEKDCFLIGRENGLLKMATARCAGLLQVVRSPLLCSHVFSDSSRDSIQFPLLEGKKFLVTAERVFFEGDKFVDFFDFITEDPPVKDQAEGPLGKGQVEEPLGGEQPGEPLGKEQAEELLREKQVDEVPEMNKWRNRWENTKWRNRWGKN